MSFGAVHICSEEFKVYQTKFFEKYVV